MPLFTPSRIAVIVLSLSLMSFLWTFGLPHQSRSSPIPALALDRPHGKPVADPVLHEPVIPPVAIDKDRPGTQSGPKIVLPGLAGPEKPTLYEEDNTALVGSQEEQEVLTPTTLRTETRPALGATATPTTKPDGPPKTCKDVHGASDVLIIIKTSKAEATDKLRAHLETLFECTSNFLIFSDHSGNLDGSPIHNALDTISNTTKERHQEFYEYEKMQDNAGYKPNEDKTTALDKWKFLPMVYKAFKMQPNHRWYVFIEPETALSWTNLLQWTDRLDYRIPIYAGVPVNRDDTRFAKSGSGILISFGALRRYTKTYEERYSEEWESHVGKECCGDMMLGRAMTESAVEFYSAFPLLQGESTESIDWPRHRWCTPLVSWSQVATSEISRIWDVEKRWTQNNGWEAPYLTRNAFEEFFLPGLEEKRIDWDNISSDTHIKAEKGRKEKLAKQQAAGSDDKKDTPAKEPSEDKPKEDEKPPPRKPAPESPQPEPPNPAKPNFQPPNMRKRDEPPSTEKADETIQAAADSAENCQALCRKTPDCMQWKWTPKGDGECHLGKVMRLGRKAGRENGQHIWVSGWMIDRIKGIPKEWGECETVNWKFNQ